MSDKLIRFEFPAKCGHHEVFWIAESRLTANKPIILRIVSGRVCLRCRQNSQHQAAKDVLA